MGFGAKNGSTNRLAKAEPSPKAALKSIKVKQKAAKDDLNTKTNSVQNSTQRQKQAKTFFSKPAKQQSLSPNNPVHKTASTIKPASKNQAKVLDTLAKPSDNESANKPQNKSQINLKISPNSSNNKAKLGKNQPASKNPEISHIAQTSQKEQAQPSSGKINLADKPSLKAAPALDESVLKLAKSHKCLLAFSHGADSTALFYLLLNLNISFDMAIVDYGLRAQSKDEVASARALAQAFKKRIFVREVSLSGGDFENRARKARYEFFSELCKKQGYTALITAHQLNDRFEWLLMRLARGAGLAEIVGMQAVSKRDEMLVLRPMLGLSRDEILAFLRENGLKYFTDSSNADFKFERNRIRASFAEPFLRQFSSGVAKSFEYLGAELELIAPEIRQIEAKIYAVKMGDFAVAGVLKVAKMLGVLASKAQRDEFSRLLKQGKSSAISGKIAVGVGKNELLGWLIITPYLKAQTLKGSEPPSKPSAKSGQDRAPQEPRQAAKYEQKSSSNELDKNQGLNQAKSQNGDFMASKSQKMAKKFKETCRVLGVPEINRAYLYSTQTQPQSIAKALKGN